LRIINIWPTNYIAYDIWIIAMNILIYTPKMKSLFERRLKWE
jgi:hypothetical protein